MRNNITFKRICLLWISLKDTPMKLAVLHLLFLYSALIFLSIFLMGYFFYAINDLKFKVFELSNIILGIIGVYIYIYWSGYLMIMAHNYSIKKISFLRKMLDSMISMSIFGVLIALFYHYDFKIGFCFLFYYVLLRWKDEVDKILLQPIDNNFLEQLGFNIQMSKVVFKKQLYLYLKNNNLKNIMSWLFQTNHMEFNPEIQEKNKIFISILIKKKEAKIFRQAIKSDLDSFKQEIL